MSSSRAARVQVPVLLACLLLGACDSQATRAAPPASAPEAESESSSTAEPVSRESQERKRAALRGLDYASGTARVDAQAAAQLVSGPDAAGSAQALEQARSFLQSNRSWDAIEAATRAVLLAPGSAPAWLLLGDTLLAKRLSGEGAAAFRAGLELDPGSTALRFGLADALIRSDERAAAIVELRAVIEREPDHAPARERLALQLYYTGDLAAAWAEVHAAEARGQSVPPQFRALLAKASAEPR